MAYDCMICETPGGAVQITTSLENGSTHGVCRTCLPIALIGQLAAELEVEPNTLYEHIRKWIDRQAKQASKAASVPAGTADGKPPTEDECPQCGNLVPLAAEGGLLPHGCVADSDGSASQEGGTS